MGAWVVGEPGPADHHPLRLVELPDPEAGPGRVLVQVAACAVCRTDLHVAEGDLPLHRTPIVPGHELVGVVVAARAGARGLRTGDSTVMTPLSKIRRAAPHGGASGHRNGLGPA